MYAVIAAGGKQLKVQKDDVLAVERVPGEAGSKIDEGMPERVAHPYRRPGYTLKINHLHTVVQFE